MDVGKDLLSRFRVFTTHSSDALHAENPGAALASKLALMGFSGVSTSDACQNTFAEALQCVRPLLMDRIDGHQSNIPGFDARKTDFIANIVARSKDTMTSVQRAWSVCPRERRPPHIRKERAPHHDQSDAEYPKRRKTNIYSAGNTNDSNDRPCPSFRDGVGSIPRTVRSSASNSLHVHPESATPDATPYGDSKGDAPESSTFRSAREEFRIQQQSRRGGHVRQNQHNLGSTRPQEPRSLGVRRKFQPPSQVGGNGNAAANRNEAAQLYRKVAKQPGNDNGSGDWGDEEIPEQYKNLDPKLVEHVQNEILDRSAPVKWDDIAGLSFQKKCVQEIVVWPMLRPDLFTGIRGPPKGLLLFGPPGTGKTLIGKAIASESGATFFSISASSLMSKWVGEGEKMVRALFAVASVHQPSVIFIDEIDSLLCRRSEGEMEATRRVKTEFLVQLDGAGTNSEDRILVLGATNRPQELDEAARRRLVKRLYVPLPEAGARKALVQRLLKDQCHALSESHIDEIIKKSDGYSGADMTALCREAALGPLRSITDIRNIDANSVPPVTFDHFLLAFSQVRASVSTSDLEEYLKWNQTFGSFPADAGTNASS